MTAPALEKAAPIPADVLALADRIARQVATSGKTGRVHQIAYEPAKEAAALAIMQDRASRASQEERAAEDERARERARVTAREKRRVITWLHQRANAMNDPHARQILNSAATNLGWDNADARLRGGAS